VVTLSRETGEGWGEGSDHYMKPRDLLLDCYRAALAAVDARKLVRAELTRRPLPGPWHVLAIGKAAAAMAQGATEALGPGLVNGLIVIPPGHVPHGFDPARHALEVCFASHPLPDQASLDAGERVTEFVTALRGDAQLLCLVSGGASSLVDRLVPGVGLDQLQALNRWALHSGASIAQINAARRALSQLKGGGLARLAGARRVQALMISDVPGDDPRVIGSGLLHATDDSTVAATPAVPTRIVASIGTATRAAAIAARAAGLQARVVRTRLQGEAAGLGMRVAASLAREPAGVLQVRGGEPTVRLPAAPGRGGRNQHLALAAALELERRGLRAACVLAAGTDGIDGTTDDAGAIVDATTCQRARDAGCDPRESLERADSGTLLEAAGDLLHTGPTLTNVGDLVLALGS
jgi:hydroxypyruvate reductase